MYYSSRDIQSLIAILNVPRSVEQCEKKWQAELESNKVVGNKGVMVFGGLMTFSRLQDGATKGEYTSFARTFDDGAPGDA